MKRIGLTVLLCLCIANAGYSVDFGLLLNQTPEYNQGGFSYSGGFSPWFSAVLGKQIDLFISGNFKLDYDQNEFYFVPELGRTQLTFQPSSALLFELGRIPFNNFNTLIASGFFDGIRGIISTNDFQFSINGLYSGLLQKNTANINISADDVMEISDPDHYFASKRVLVSMSLGFPSVFSSRNSLDLGVLGQFDLRDSGKVHSQYATASFHFNFASPFAIDLSGIFSLVEPEGSDIKMGGAASADVIWQLPTKAQDRLLIGANWSSGAKDTTSLPFQPINNMDQGQILSAKMSALMTIKAGYTIRIIENLSLNASGIYFLRTDLTTYEDSGLDPASDSYLLGGEFYGSLLWAPFSDLSLILNGGAFLPSLGKAFSSDAPAQWKIGLTLIFSI